MSIDTPLFCFRTFGSYQCSQAKQIQSARRDLLAFNRPLVKRALGSFSKHVTNLLAQINGGDCSFRVPFAETKTPWATPPPKLAKSPVRSPINFFTKREKVTVESGGEQLSPSHFGSGKHCDVATLLHQEWHQSTHILAIQASAVPGCYPSTWEVCLPRYLHLLFSFTQMGLTLPWSRGTTMAHGCTHVRGTRIVAGYLYGS